MWTIQSRRGSSRESSQDPESTTAPSSRIDDDVRRPHWDSLDCQLSWNALLGIPIHCRLPVETRPLSTRLSEPSNCVKDGFDTIKFASDYCSRCDGTLAISPCCRDPSDPVTLTRTRTRRCRLVSRSRSPPTTRVASSARSRSYAEPSAYSIDTIDIGIRLLSLPVEYGVR